MVECVEKDFWHKLTCELDHFQPTAVAHTDKKGLYVVLRDFSSFVCVFFSMMLLSFRQYDKEDQVAE